MGKNKKAIIIPVIIILIIALVYFFSWNSKQPGEHDSFASCLTEKEIIMAGTDWCHFCKDQKELFGRSFKLVDYINCDTNKQWCNSQGVEGYPTWIFPDGGKYPGVQSFERLSSLSGCEL